jgi:hypothetical protein
MRLSTKQSSENRKSAIGRRRSSTATGPPGVRLQPRIAQRVRRLDGALPVSIGTETIALDALCPTKMSIAIHKRLLLLMESDPVRFPALSMCCRTHRHDQRLRLAYGSAVHSITMDEAREYLSRLIGGFAGRHDESDPKP